MNAQSGRESNQRDQWSKQGKKYGGRMSKGKALRGYSLKKDLC